MDMEVRQLNLHLIRTMWTMNRMMNGKKVSNYLFIVFKIVYDKDQDLRLFHSPYELINIMYTLTVPKMLNSIYSLCETGSTCVAVFCFVSYLSLENCNLNILHLIIVAHSQTHLISRWI